MTKLSRKQRQRRNRKLKKLSVKKTVQTPVKKTVQTPVKTDNLCLICDRSLIANESFKHVCNNVICSMCMIENIYRYKRPKCAYCNVKINEEDLKKIEKIYNDNKIKYNPICVSMVKDFMNCDHIDKIGKQVFNYTYKNKLPKFNLLFIIDQILYKYDFRFKIIKTGRNNILIINNMGAVMFYDLIKSNVIDLFLITEVYVIDDNFNINLYKVNQGNISMFLGNVITPHGSLLEVVKEILFEINKTIKEDDHDLFNNLFILNDQCTLPKYQSPVSDKLSKSFEGLTFF